MTAHSRISPSKAHIWMACPGSVQLTANLPRTTSPAAEEGIAAHELAAKCAENQVDAWTAGADGETSAAVQKYLDFISSFYPLKNRGIEYKLHAPDIHRDFSGTVDFWAWDQTPGAECVVVADYKHGAGVAVSAQNNAQLMMYGFGLLHALRIDADIQVLLCIIQPRVSREDSSAVDVFDIPAAELRAWGREKLLPAISATEQPLPPLKSGEHCRFCPARSNGCPTVHWDLMNGAYRVSEPLSGEMSDENLSAYLTLVDKISSLKTDLEEQVYQRLQAGRQLNGFKLVNAVSRRIWRDGVETLAEELFGGKAFTAPALLSPAQMEKLPGGSRFTAEHSFKPDKGLSLARDHDRRQAVNTDTKSLFTEVVE